MILVILLVLCVAFIVVATARFHLHAFLALIAAALLFGLLSGMEPRLIVTSIEEGFGGVLGRIGIVIVAGTLIGKFLEKSGGAAVLATRLLAWIGQKRVPLAMSVVGYTVSIPVFADSAFVILAPLNRALTKRARLSLATTAVALVMGLQASHTMMPPTPGPIAAAGILGADLGLVMLIGLPVSFAVAMLGWAYAELWASRTWIDPDPDGTIADMPLATRDAPSAGHAVAPIIVPIVLIVLRSVSELATRPFGDGQLAATLSFVGTPLVALLIGVLIALTLPKRLDTQMLSASGWVGEALVAAAVIILITGAGGAFGRVLQNSGIADVIGSALVQWNLGLWMPFLIAAAIRASQGSATVAIITTASLLAPLTATLGLDAPTAKALMVLAIGAGSMVASHANDSMFWIVAQMSFMDVRTGYRLQTVGTILLGFSAATILWLIGLVVL